VGLGITATGDGFGHLAPEMRKPAFWASLQPVGVATTRTAPIAPRVTSVSRTAVGHGDVIKRVSLLIADPPYESIPVK
jgi:hypothetical protein